MDQTKHYMMNMPAGTDPVHINDLNGNTSVIDELMYQLDIAVHGMGGRNYIQNGSFENNTINGWQLSTADTGTISVTTDTAWDGSKSLKFVCSTDASVCGITRSIGDNPAFFAGKTITLSMKVKGTSALVGKSMDVDIWNDVTGDTPGKVVKMDGTWQTVTVTATIPANATLINLYWLADNLYSGDTVYIDAVKLELGYINTDWTPALEDIEQDLSIHEQDNNRHVTVYQTTNSGNSSMGQWTKIASFSTTTTNVFSNAIINFQDFTAYGVIKGKLYINITQNALGAAPGVVLKLTDSEAVSTSNFMAVIVSNTTSQTIVELYYKEQYASNCIVFSPSNNNNNYITFYSNQPYLPALPAGAQVVCQQVPVDANTVDGHPATDFAPSGYGLGTLAKDISNTDLNNCLTTGFYKGGTLTNNPVGSSNTNNWYILVIRHSGTYVTQEATAFWGADKYAKYWRCLDNGIWKAWKQFESTDNKNQSNGYMGLDSNAKALITNMPDAITVPNPNLLPNSSGEAGINYWDDNAGGRITVLNSPTAGMYFYFAGSTGSSEYPKIQSHSLNCVAGTTLTASVDMDASNITAGSIVLNINFYDSSKKFISQAYVNATNGLGWVRYSKTAVAPANTAYVTVAVQKNASTTGAGAWRRIKLEYGSVATPYSQEADFATGYPLENQGNKNAVGGYQGIDANGNIPLPRGKSIASSDSSGWIGFGIRNNGQSLTGISDWGQPILLESGSCWVLFHNCYVDDNGVSRFINANSIASDFESYGGGGTSPGIPQARFSTNTPTKDGAITWSSWYRIENYSNKNTTGGYVGIDADGVMDAVGSRGFGGKYLDISVLGTITDINNIVTPGIYETVWASSIANEPISGGTNLRRVVIKVGKMGDTTPIHQEITYIDGYNTGTKYFRYGDSSTKTFSGWITIYTSANLTKLSQLTNDSGYITSENILSQVFTSSGTFTTPKTGKYKVIVTGGGGSGGWGQNSSSHNIAYGGGGAGGTAIKFVSLTAGTQVSVTIGTGGAAITSGTGGVPGVPGNNGGTSSFGSYCSATGGYGGSVGSNRLSDGGVGGTGSGGDINMQGDNGDVGIYLMNYGNDMYYGCGGCSFFGANYGNGGRGGGNAGGSGIVTIEWVG